MTLILSCITPTFVIQVSDRRLICLDGPHKGKVKDDNANKMIVLCNRLTLAYTGLTEIGSQKTDHWLLNVLAEIKPYNPHKAIEAIAERASRAFRFLQGSPEHKRQAFVVAGWARFSKDGELTPFLSAISNALDDAWNWQDLPQDEFSVRTMPLPVYTPVEVAWTGQKLDPHLMDHLRREVRRYYEHNTGPSAYVRLLAETIRNIAKENKSVGRRLLAISLPLEGITHQSSITMRFDASFPRDVVTSLYIPEDAEDGVAYGPHFICNRFSFRDVYARPGIFSSQGPEVPPWFQGPLVLSRRIGRNQNRDSIRPALGDDYDLRGWGMVAEYRRDVEERPTPCLIYIGPETPDLSIIEQDERYFVITNGPEEASLQVEQEWLNRLYRWLVNAGLNSDEVQPFAETIFPRATRAYVVCYLRTFFRAPLSVDS